MINNYLIDSCVILGFVNTKDINHEKCKSFLLGHQSDRYYIPIHSRFEIHGSMSRRKRGNDFSGLPLRFKRNFIDLAVDKLFYRKCREERLFEIFSTLKGGDLIFACMAKLKGYILVTCDDDFNCYSNIIKIVQL